MQDIKEINGILPNLFCVGPPKCGTTTLYDIFKNHKDIFLPEIKEPGFFSDEINYSRGLEYYRKAYYSNTKGKKIVGDFSPTYFASEVALERIKKDIDGEIKIIVVLREPVKRAYSHYLHRVRDGIEERTFERSMHEDTLSEKSVGYISNGMYGAQLKKLIRIFGEKNILVLIFEKDIVSNIDDGINKICTFLDIETIRNKEQIVSNSAKSSMFGMRWIRKAFHKESKIKDKIKKIIPTKKRQYIRLMFDRITTKEGYKPEKLNEAIIESMNEKYFKKDLEIIKEYCNYDFKKRENK